MTNYLSCVEMAVKYNKTLELMYYYAVNNKLPYDILKTGKRESKNYKFFPHHEELFANRPSSRRTSPLCRICVISHRKDGVCETFCFKGFKAACLYITKYYLPKNPEISCKPSFFVPGEGIHFKTFYRSLSSSDAAKIDAFLAKNKKCSFLCAVTEGNDKAAVKAVFDASSVSGQEEFLKYVFSLNRKRASCCFLGKGETTPGFRRRIFELDRGEDQIPKSTLKKLFPTMEPCDEI